MLSGVNVMNVEDNKIVKLSAEIWGDLLLEFFGSELESLKWREPQSEQDFEEIRFNIDF